MKKEFMYIPYIMSWLQHMAHKKRSICYRSILKRTKKWLLQVSWNFVIIIKISFVIRTLQPTLLGAHYTIIVWFDSKKTNSFTARPWNTWSLGAGTLGIHGFELVPKTLDIQGLLANIRVSRKFSYLKYLILN